MGRAGRRFARDAADANPMPKGASMIGVDFE